MKKYLIALSTLLFSLNASAAFLTLYDGVTPSSDLSVQIEGVATGFGVSVEDTVLSTVQFQLVALDETTDDYNSDGLLTVQFGYYDAIGTWLGWDTAGYSVLWSDIVAAQATATATAELVFASDFMSVVSGPYETGYSLASGEGDYYVLAVLEGQEFVGEDIIYAIDLEVPQADPTDPVPAPASFGLLALTMLGFRGLRSLRK